MNYGFFGEDHWKLTPRLTFDLGLRYDYEALPPPYSTLVAASGSFTPYLASTNGLCAAYTGPGTCPALAAAGQYHQPSQREEQLRPARRYRIRSLRQRQDNRPPRLRPLLWPHHQRRAVEQPAEYRQPARPVHLSDIQAEFRGRAAVSQHHCRRLGIDANLVTSSRQNFKNPEVHEFDLSVQQAVGHGTVFQLSYMGALGRELPNAVNINFNPNANTVATASGTQRRGPKRDHSLRCKRPGPASQRHNLTSFPPTPITSTPISAP